MVPTSPPSFGGDRAGVLPSTPIRIPSQNRRWVVIPLLFAIAKCSYSLTTTAECATTRVETAVPLTEGETRTDDK